MVYNGIRCETEDGVALITLDRLIIPRDIRMPSTRPHTGNRIHGHRNMPIAASMACADNGTCPDRILRLVVAQLTSSRQ
jgi:hypothetical protein